MKEIDLVGIESQNTEWGGDKRRGGHEIRDLKWGWVVGEIQSKEDFQEVKSHL